MRKIKKRCGAAILAMMSVGSFAGSAFAEEAASASDDWRVSLAPYFWAAGQTGNMKTFGAPEVQADLKFKDIFDNLDFSAMMLAEARKGRYSISSDFLYLKITQEADLPYAKLAEHGSLSTRTIEAALMVGYSVVDDDDLRLDVIVGPRFWSVKQRVQITGGFFDGTDRTDSATWADGMAGFRWHYGLTDALGFNGWAMAGAGRARFDWDAAATFNYRISDSFAAIAGYRITGVDYRQNDFIYDVKIQGPLLGASFSF